MMMKKILLTLTISIISVVAFSQEREHNYTKADIPEGFVPDTRIDNMGYWRRLADLEIVPRQARVFVAPPVYRGSEIKARSVKTTNSPDVPVTVETSTQSENSIFAHPNDPETILNSNNSTTNPVSGVLGSNAFYSFDGALTWGGSIQGAGGTNQGDPAAAIGMNGYYYAGQIKNSGQAVAWSDDEGATWTTVQVANAAGGFNDLLDKNHLWIDNSLTSPHNGNLYDAWTAFGGSNDNEIEISYSADNGQTWIGPVNISSAVNAGSHNQGVNISTGPQGQVYAAWTIYDSWPQDENAIGFARSMDGGQTYEPAFRIIENIRGIRNTETSKNMRVNSFPCMAVDISSGPRSGWIYVVWSNIGVPGENNGPDIDVYMIRSQDGGSTWTSPKRVNQDEMNQGHEHYMPWITCDPASGALSVVFYDDRNVGGSSVEVFCANSYDGGDTWEDFAVSDIAFTPAPIPGLASGYMGDYLGITAQNGYVYPCWTDNRDGFAMTYVSPYKTGAAPAAAIEPYPTDGQQLVLPFTHFAWTDGTIEGDTATQYRFFLGTNNPPNNIINGEFVNDTFFLPPAGTLNGNTPYKWRIRAMNDFGYTDSPVWSFRTAPPADEDFESGDFTQWEWYHEGDSEWTVEEGVTKNGVYAAQSGDVTHSQSSSLKLELDVNAFDEINFWVKVSSEEGGDSLTFYIDGIAKESWSGETGWVERTFITGPGPHVFEWKYAKDEQNSDGDDAAWIDFIFFPELVGLTAAAGEDQEICQDETAQMAGQANNYQFVKWYTSGDGTFDDVNILNPVYTHGGQDVMNGTVMLSMTAYGELEGDSIMDHMTLTINPLPMQPEMPEGPDYVDTYYTSSSEYTTTEIENVSWVWTLMPEEAGEIAPEANSAVVNWSSEFQGLATVAVMAQNDCGDGPVSEELEIIVDNTVGVGEKDEVSVSVRPNPNNGIFTLEFGSPVTSANAYISVMDQNGRERYRIYPEEGQRNATMNISNAGSGTYFLIFRDGERGAVEKVIVR